MKYEYSFPPEVLEKAAELGYAPHRVPLLFLAPVVQVAWAEGFVQPSEQKTILNFAASMSVEPGTSAFEELIKWFDERPSDEDFSAALNDLDGLLASLSPLEAARYRGMLQQYCIQTARSAGDIGILRSSSNIRREELEVLRAIGERVGLSQAFAQL